MVEVPVEKLRNDDAAPATAHVSASAESVRYWIKEEERNIARSLSRIAYMKQILANAGEPTE